MENKNDSTINNKQNVIAEDKSKEKLDENKEINKEDAENKDYEVEILNYSEENAPKDLLNFKIIIIGNSGVGKTSITNNATKNIFIENYRSTIGMEIFSLYIKINHRLLKLQIWDTCGQEIYRSLITNFYRNSSLAIIVYSIDKRDSFKDIDIWIRELKAKSSPDIKIVLIGNKIDLDNSRQVSYEEGAKYLEHPEIIKFCETSAKTGENIQKIFKEVAIALYKDYIKYGDDNELKKSESFQTTNADMKPKKKSCC
jgi:small GTP-binding protein